MFILRMMILASAVLFACARPNPSPNIIFLLTDDQRWDALGAMGNPIIQTPEMDKLAAQGTLFRNAYVTTAICAVSRATLLSGQFARRHGIHDFRTTFSDSALMQTYPLQLKEAGYRIGFIGKYGIGQEKDVPAAHFDYWQAMARQPEYTQTDEQGNYQHYTRKVGGWVHEFLAAASPSQPFCLSVSFKAPHVQDKDPLQFLSDPAYDHLYADITIPDPETPDDFARFPEFFTENNEARSRWQIRFATPELYQRSVKGYYRLITGVDVVLGEMRAQLQELGLAENTIIVLMSDNGFYLGEHGLAGKWYGHEESIRVPLIVYDPRVPQAKRGVQRDEIALNIDIAPTLLQYAGLEVPGGMQGASLLPVINGTATDWRQDFFYEHLFPHPKIPKSEGVVTLKQKYMRYLEQEPEFEELYDLQSDPRELQNLAKQEHKAAMLIEMRARLQSLRAAAH